MGSKLEREVRAIAGFTGEIACLFTNGDDPRGKERWRGLGVRSWP